MFPHHRRDACVLSDLSLCIHALLQYSHIRNYSPNESPRYQCHSCRNLFSPRKSPCSRHVVRSLSPSLNWILLSSPSLLPAEWGLVLQTLSQQRISIDSSEEDNRSNEGCCYSHSRNAQNLVFPHSSMQTMNMPLHCRPVRMIHCESICCTPYRLCCSSVLCLWWHHTRILLYKGMWWREYVTVRFVTQSMQQPGLCAASQASRSYGVPSFHFVLEPEDHGWMHHAHQLYV